MTSLYKRLFLFVASLLCSFSVIGQSLFPNPGILFNNQVVPRIDIEISEGNLSTIFTSGNEESDDHFPVTFYFDDGEFKDTMPNVGFRLRGNTSRYSRKKSFKLSFNTFEKGRKWQGVEKINLNGEHNDPTVSRARFCFNLLREMGVPAPRANHVQLYINGIYAGLYANIEHIDEEFVDSRFGNNDGNLYKCTWPADMNYLGDDPDLYKYLKGDERAYDLKRNEEEDDYSDLANLIDVLNNTPVDELPCAIEPIFNIDILLKSIVFDILSGNWDGPLFNKNNFYLYNNEETGRIEYIPFDLDNTFGIDWFSIDWATRNMYIWGHPDEPRPLYWRILEVPEYLNRFSFFMDQTIQNIFTEQNLFPKLDFIRDQVAPFIEADPFYSLDYGFDMEDFMKGFDEMVPFNHTKRGIKEFISLRHESTKVQLPPIDYIPYLKDVHVEQVSTSLEFTIQVQVEEDNALEKVEFCFKTNSEGAFQCVELRDDGNYPDSLRGDGIYGAAVMIEKPEIFYYIQALDDSGQSGIFPACGNINREVVQASDRTLAINEFMASNDTTIADEFGEFDDWLEIHNYGEESLQLGGLYLSDNFNNPTKWAFPDTSIDAGGFMIVWTDDDSTQGPLHTTYKLSAGGEYIGIFDSDENSNALIDGVEFGEQVTDQAIGRIPNGTGEFQLVEATPGSSNEPITSIFAIDDIDISYSIGPNPTSQTISLISNEIMDRALHVYISDAFGRQVFNGPWQNSLDIDMSGLSQGMYFLYIVDDHSVVQIEKILKK